MAIVAAPILDLFDALDPFESMVHPLLQTLGVGCFAMGFVLTVRAQLETGASWRIGVDVSEKAALITDGVFRLARNSTS